MRRGIFFEGAPLELHEIDAHFDRPSARILGPYANDAEPTRVVVAGSWQAARSLGDYSLVGCSVAPGFDFADFELLRDKPSEAETLERKHPGLAAFI